MVACMMMKLITITPKGDITSPDFMAFVLKEKQIDIIFHLAAQTHVDNSFGDSFEFTRYVPGVTLCDDCWLTWFWRACVCVQEQCHGNTCDAWSCQGTWCQTIYTCQHRRGLWWSCKPSKSLGLLCGLPLEIDGFLIISFSQIAGRTLY